MPITLVDRARAQLRRFFSEGPWTVEDDAGLSGLVGPGEGWTEEELAPGIRLSYGWRGGNFKVEVDADAEAPPRAKRRRAPTRPRPSSRRTNARSATRSRSSSSSKRGALRPS